MASSNKRWKFILLISCILGLAILSLYSNAKYENALRNWKTAVANEKAYAARYDNINKTNKEFQFTIDQLRYSNDSIVQHLLKVKSDLKIKDKNIKEMEYLYSSYSKSDTLYMTDTIFINDFEFDTVIGDEWMHSHIKLKYPNSIGVESCITSKKDVMITSSKETINPPKKFFLFRLFQKKHDVIKVDVLEENPHIQSEDNVFIRVIDR